MLRTTSLLILAAGAGAGVAGLQLKMDSSDDDWFDDPPAKIGAPVKSTVTHALDFLQAAKQRTKDASEGAAAGFASAASSSSQPSERPPRGSDDPEWRSTLR